MAQLNQTPGEESKTKPGAKKSKAKVVKTKTSNSKLALGVAAAVGGSFVAATWFGLGPAVLAGTAGYLTYQGLKNKVS